MTASIELDTAVTECGDDVTGVVSGVAGTATVELAWHTTGRGAQDAATVASVSVDPDGDGRARFAMDVPADGPMSIDGTLLQVVWEVRLVGGGAEASITVLPRGGLAMWVRQAGAPPQA